MARKRTRSSRTADLCSAFANGIHWGQVLLQETGKGKGDPALFSRGALPLAQVQAQAQRFERLAATPSQTVAGWASGKAPSPETDAAVAELLVYPCPADERLPVNLLFDRLRKRVEPRDAVSVRAVATLFQLCLEIAKDGTVLQDLFRIYIALGLKVDLEQLGLPAADADWIALARELSPRSAACPFDTGVPAFHITFAKIENWGEKNTGRRDKHVLAEELLKDPEVVALIPALKALPPKRAAYLGFSMLMSLNWSTHGSWCDVAGEALKRLNPNFEYGDFQTGGITASRALVKHLPEVLAFRPTETFLLMSVLTQEDRDAYEKMLAQLKAAGSEVFVIDDVRPWVDRDNPKAFETFAFYREAAKRAHGRFLNFYDLGKTAPGWEKWECLDRIHMVTEGHLFYAKALLRIWAGR